MHRASADSPGTMIVIVGPSGAGKDSVIGFAASRFAGCDDVDIVRRVITRPSDAGGEDHESVSDELFESRLKAGDFAVAWQAHGLKYAIPRQALDRVRAGQIVVANGSRAVLDQFRLVFPAVRIVNVTVSPQVLAARLVSRGRESEADILKRLQRQAPDILEAADVTTIDNSGPLETAGTHFVQLIEALRRSRRNASEA
ncbi:phosphonate metabolism protein/1,5-bisphosphokinase (PRPP-forming) PhnN [Pararhizobium gei]|uniref:phosphonate metabolism protein/1,5-bisphosphokinase (PRPP-forming) PhnN n=1 Tax=Pararhizobium gei TaxID=1395951 RepID=UPI0023DCCB53|nr:phosphonate metabolism protein/1,5-bisphosphokinase (PRPP-forming) PhnN [Rhizobium gei]